MPQKAHMDAGSDEATSARAERFQRRRTRLVMVSGLAFVSWMSTYSAGRLVSPEHTGLANLVQLVAFVVWAVSLLVVLSTGGGLLRDPAVRKIVEDELTQANRRSAFVFGYWALLVAAAGFYAGALFVPVPAIEALLVLLAVGVAAPALRFALLERWAERDG